MPSDPPRHRLGPRPLPLHLAAASLAWTSSLAALPLLRNGSLAWRPELAPAARALAADLAAANPEAVAAAIACEADRRLNAFLEAVRAYRRHSYRPPRPAMPILWQEGTTRLLDYGKSGGGNGGRKAQAAPILVVPSLINRCDILDLVPERSFMRFLAGQGLRPFLVDWGHPGETERGFGLADYVLKRLGSALEAVRARCGRAPVLVGYCMGGTLALGLAEQRAAELGGLVLLAAPWDFHAERPEQALLLGALLPLVEPLLAALGELPVDVIQTLFAALDPALALRKFLGFAALDPASERARHFVALEDWLNDGVPLAAPVARECLGRWYGENAPARGAWRLGGRPVLPRRIEIPCLAVIPDQDRIVPPASASALAAALPDCSTLRPATGHIGMMSGSRAEAAVWRPLVEWVLARAVSCTATGPSLESARKAKRRQP